MERLSGAALYRSGAERVMELVAQANPDTPVPACPGWVVSDVVAHVVGLAEDVVTGNVHGYATSEWTDAQVVRRSHQSLAEMTNDWQSLLAAFVAIVDDLERSHLPDTIDTAIGPVPKTAFEFGYAVDLVNHEHDLRSALGQPRPPLPDHDGAIVRAMVTTARMTFAFEGLPSVTLRASDADLEWPMSRDEPVATCDAALLDILRSVAGRRTLEQMRALGWQGEVGDDVLAGLVVPFFSLPTEPVE